MRSIVLERSLAAHRIAAGRFDEKNFSAEVREQQTAVAAHASGKIQNAQTV